MKEFVDKYVEIKGEKSEGETVDIPKNDFSQHPMESVLDEEGNMQLQMPKTKVVGAGFKVYDIREIDKELVK